MINYEVDALGSASSDPITDKHKQKPPKSETVTSSFKIEITDISDVKQLHDRFDSNLFLIDLLSEYIIPHRISCNYCRLPPE